MPGQKSFIEDKRRASIWINIVFNFYSNESIHQRKVLDVVFLVLALPQLDDNTTDKK